MKSLWPPSKLSLHEKKKFCSLDSLAEHSYEYVFAYTTTTTTTTVTAAAATSSSSSSFSLVLSFVLRSLLQYIECVQCCHMRMGYLIFLFERKTNE